MMMIDICLLSCNRRRITEIAITELRRRTTTPHRLTVLDNGSEDGSQEMLKELKVDRVIDRLYLNEHNWGVHYGFNALLDLVDSELYVCTDGDLVPPSIGRGVFPDWLTELVHLMYRNAERLSQGELHTEYSAISCRPHVMIGDNPRRFNNAPEVLETGWCGAALRLMRTEAVKQVGGWMRDRKAPSRNNEERYICGKLKQAGGKVGIARDVQVIHLFGDDSLGEDPWGYSEGMVHEGHREIWPPANHYGWERMGMDWHTCKPKVKSD